MNDNIPSAPIGAQLRRLRLARGMSLRELARRAGTSAPSLHRYESGWDRFEIATLRRIAAALSARLDVTLSAPDSRKPAARPAKAKLLRSLSPLFWDTKLTGSILTDHPHWVLGRVLGYGDLEQVHAARRFFGDDAIRAAISRRDIDRRTRNYWKTILGGRRAPESVESRGLEHRS
ncbi:MAG: helix-turn-helix transcriptional regulator [Gammaproteobacteria bacterium]|nr:helix-turn-helix transcriptional regulator [Gammaproteobacteria bacterium]